MFGLFRLRRGDGTKPLEFRSIGGDEEWWGGTLGDACYAVLCVIEIRELGNDKISRVRRHERNNVKELMSIQVRASCRMAI
jgi:hypothetical protein